MNNGWVRLWRKTKDNVFLMKNDNAYLVFTKLLICVNSNGQWAGGRHQLSEYMNMNESTLYKTLQRLEREQLIMIESNTRYTVYSICKWSHYQQNGNSPNQLKVTSGEQRSNNAVTTREHSNKNKNKELRIRKPAAGLSKIDKELAAKELAARTRSSNVEGPGYKKARAVIEIIKQKRSIAK